MATVEAWLAAVASLAFCVLSLVHLFVRRSSSSPSILPVHSALARRDAGMVVSRWNARSRSLEPMTCASTVGMLTQPVVMAAKKAAALVLPAVDMHEHTLKASFAPTLSGRGQQRVRSPDGLLHLCELKRSRARPDGDLACGSNLRRYAMINNHLSSVKRESRTCEGIEAA